MLATTIVIMILFVLLVGMAGIMHPMDEREREIEDRLQEEYLREWKKEHEKGTKNDKS